MTWEHSQWVAIFTLFVCLKLQEWRLDIHQKAIKKLLGDNHDK